MPQIFVTTNSREGDHGAVLLQERINPLDLESDHFSARLIERLGWALADADEVEYASGEKSSDSLAREATPKTSPTVGPRTSPRRQPRVGA